MEPEGSLLHSQVPATCPYPEPDQSSTCPHLTSWRSILILSSHRHLRLPSGLFPSGFPTQTLHTPLLSTIRAGSPAHLILLELITIRIFDLEYRSQRRQAGPYHHGMARPQVVDWGTASNMEEAANILNKQSRTADKGWSSILGDWARSWQFLTVKTYLVTRHEHLPRTWTDPLVEPQQRK